MYTPNETGSYHICTDWILGLGTKPCTFQAIELCRYHQVPICVELTGNVIIGDIFFDISERWQGVVVINTVSSLQHCPRFDPGLNTKLCLELVLPVPVQTHVA